MGARVSGIATAAIGARAWKVGAALSACALVLLLSGCAESQLHVDMKNDAKQLDAGSISKVVCTQEFGPSASSLYTYVVAISGSDHSDEVISRLGPMGFTEDPAQSDPGDVSLYTAHRRIRAEVRSYPGDKKQVTFGGGQCDVPSDGLTEIAFVGLDDPPSGG